MDTPSVDMYLYEVLLNYLEIRSYSMGGTRESNINTIICLPFNAIAKHKNTLRQKYYCPFPFLIKCHLFCKIKRMIYITDNLGIGDKCSSGCRIC